MKACEFLNFRHRFSIKCQDKTDKSNATVKDVAIITPTEIPGIVAAIDC
jgi:hypothetical protein